MEKTNLEYLFLIKYAVKDIDKIKNIDDITSKFKDSIENITEVAHDRFDYISQVALFHKYIGQENYFFKFTEDASLFGEFSLDLLPVNGNKYLKDEMQNVANGILDKNYEGEKRLANFRIQLFLEKNASYSIIEEKNKEVVNYINELYGKPNNSPEVIEFISFLEEQFNNKINGWHLKRGETDYFISHYLVDSTIELGPYISFSISEYLAE